MALNLPILFLLLLGSMLHEYAYMCPYFILPWWSLAPEQPQQGQDRSLSSDGGGLGHLEWDGASWSCLELIPRMLGELLPTQGELLLTWGNSLADPGWGVQPFVSQGGGATSTSLCV